MKPKRISIYYVFIFFFFLIQISYSQQSIDTFHYGLPVLPGVTGFGLDSKGGRDGEIIKVTNLKKEGNGSLLEAIKSDGPRIIVFEVAGVIDLERNTLEILNPFITIAGQTAPFPGITIIQGGIKIRTHDVIIQHIKVRPGEAGQKKKSGWEIDGISTSGGAYNVIIDHCSITWATDENLSASGPRFEGDNTNEWRKNTSHKIVFSNCIIAEGLSNSTHKKGEHSKGSLIHDNATEILVIGNLYANNKRRNPFCKGGSQVSILNNFIYNPGTAAIHYKLVKSEWKGFDWITGKIITVGNYIEFGNNTISIVSGGSFHGPVEVFWENNLITSNDKVKELSGNYTPLESAPFWPEGLIVKPAIDVKKLVLKNAGAFPWERDDIDKRIITEVKSGIGKIIDSEIEVGGYPIIKPVYRKFEAEEWDLNTLTKKADNQTKLNLTY
ncbi:polysaccharide lyase family 1 protein [Bacteroidota bacterium]